jgi:hypothetical protein
MQANKRALLVVDVQNDFCEQGSLPVPGASQIVPVINNLRSRFEVGEWILIHLASMFFSLLIGTPLAISHSHRLIMAASHSLP